MAFTKTPTQSTEQTKSVPLLYRWDSRDNSTNGYDTLFKNALVEPVGEEYYHVLKRSGSEAVSINPPPTTSSQERIVGCYYWQTPSVSYLVIVVRTSGSTGTIRLVNVETFISIDATGTIISLLLADAEIGFEEFLFQDGSTRLLINVSNQLYELNVYGILNPIVTGLTQFGASVVYLDGYAFIHDNANIYNSNLNDPTVWSPSNFLAADSYPDNIARIARVGPYIIALGSESIQYFYNAANPTVTPLGAHVGLAAL